MARTVQQRIREVQRLARTTQPLQQVGTPGPGRGHAKPSAQPRSPRGMTKAYLVARIARDHPDILERMQAGQFETVRQAAIAAGILTVPTRLEQFDKLWRNATLRDRVAIAVDVYAWFLWQPVELRDVVSAYTVKRLAQQEPPGEREVYEDEELDVLREEVL